MIGADDKVGRHPSRQTILAFERQPSSSKERSNSRSRLGCHLPTITWMTGIILLECLTALSPHLSSRTEVTRWELSWPGWARRWEAPWDPERYIEWSLQWGQALVSHQTTAMLAISDIRGQSHHCHKVKERKKWEVGRCWNTLCLALSLQGQCPAIGNWKFLH